MKELTPTERKVYDYVISYQELRGVSPSLQTIANAMGNKTKGSAHNILKKLEKKGLVKLGNLEQVREIKIL